jgi:hypothetical protein
VGEGHAGGRHDGEPRHQALLHAPGGEPVGVVRRRQEHGDQVEVGASRDGVAAHHAAVQVAAVQPGPELAAEQLGGGLRHAPVLRLHVRQVGLGNDVALGVDPPVASLHPTIVADGRR